MYWFTPGDGIEMFDFFLVCIENGLFLFWIGSMLYQKYVVSEVMFLHYDGCLSLL